jgi:hypothetical protein
MRVLWRGETFPARVLALVESGQTVYLPNGRAVWPQRNEA